MKHRTLQGAIAGMLFACGAQPLMAQEAPTFAANLHGLSMVAGSLVTDGPAVPDDLRTQVLASFGSTYGFFSHDSSGQSEILVEILKEDGNGTHVMGSATRLLPADVHDAPTPVFFFAQREGEVWKVGLSGEPDYVATMERMPADIVSPDEMEYLKAAEAGASLLAAGSFVGVGLPWAMGTVWRMSGGLHGAAYESVDFAGGNGRVLAAASGKVYRTCVSDGSALFTIVHPSGYSSSYYHLQNVTAPGNGSSIAAGAFLGNIGVKVQCGGRATGPHVHFSLLKGSTKVTVDNKVLGGWTFHRGSALYRGTATRGKTTAGVGGSLTNYGPADRGL